MRLRERLRHAMSILAKGASGVPFDLVPGLTARPTDLAMPFAQSVWVNRAIKKIAGPIAGVPLKFTVNDQDHDDPQLTAFWSQPARRLTFADFVEASVGWLKLQGEAFWLMDDSSLRPFPEVSMFSPLIVARPDRMREIVERGELVGWQYRDIEQRVWDLLPEQVIQPLFWNPYDPWRGLAEYAAARIATEADYAAGEYALNLMRNNGDTGPIIASKNGMLTDEQQRQIVAQLRMKQEYARRGDFRAAFLTSDVTVESPNAQTTDANFAAMRLGNRHEIFLAFGVPPSMADKMESYSVGSASDWFMLITETCIPTAEKLAQKISEVARKQTGIADLECYFDFDEHPVMQQVRRERLDAAGKLWAMGMPLEAANEYLDLGMDEFDGWDVGYLPFAVAPVGESRDLPEDDAFPDDEEPEEAEETPITDALRALRNYTAPRPQCDCCGLDLANLAVRAGDSKRVRLWKNIVAKRRETIRAYESKFNALLMVARREVLGKLEAAAVRAPMQRASASDFIFNLDEFRKVFRVSFRTIASNALQAAGDQVFAEVGKSDAWTMPPAGAVEFFQNRENKLAKVPDAIFERIRGALADGIERGDPLRDIAKAVRAEFNEISKKRAMVIAQTETAAAYGTARDAALKEAGVQWKEWLTSGNSNIRAAHRLMNGTIIPVNEKFIVVNPDTGETDEVKHPGDPQGQPWNVINCHCVEIAVARGPEGIVEPSEPTV